MNNKFLTLFISLTIVMLSLSGCDINSNDINDFSKSISSIDPSSINISDEDIAAVMNTADILNDILNQGYCWIACSGNEALVLYLDGDKSFIKTVSNDNSLSEDDISGQYSLDENFFAIYSDLANDPESFSWSITFEDDVTILELTGEEKSATYYKTQISNPDDAIALAQSYISNKSDKDIEEIIDSIIAKSAAEDNYTEESSFEDISSTLGGFRGVSIVDAFIYAGLEPSYKNRALFAKKAGIDNYTGTAAQNIELLKYMGGILK